MYVCVCLCVCVVVEERIAYSAQTKCGDFGFKPCGTYTYH